MAAPVVWKHELKFMSEALIATEPETDREVSGHTARRLETRRKLLEAGTQLFAERGRPAVTSTEIARRAGVATGTFYLHFADKHALFEVLVDEALDEIRSQFHPDPLAPRSDDERRDEIERMVAVVERRRDLVRAVFDRGADAGFAERIRDRIATRLEPVYARRFRQARLGLHAGAAAQARAATLVRVIAWWADDPSRASRSEIVDLLVELDPVRLSGRTTDSADGTPTASDHRPTTRSTAP
jgi:AcrR family transcriptional regulator